MAGTINYDYDINQDVYVIDICENNMYVIGGNVRLISAQVNNTETIVKYNIRLAGSRGTKDFVATDVFADKSSAITEYDSRIL